MENKINYYRKLKNLTVHEMAEKMGITRGYLSDLIHGKNKKRWNVDLLNKASAILGCTVSDLMQDSKIKKPQISLVGYIGAGTKLNCELVDSEAIDWFDPDELGFSSFPHGSKLLQVQGNSMSPAADDGDYLVINTNDIKRGLAIDELINQRVAAIDKDGYSYFKILRRGSKKNFYTLQSFNTTELMEDIELKCAVFVGIIIHKMQKK